MNVFVSAKATPAQVDTIRQALLATGHIDPARLEYLDAQASLAAAKVLFADDPDAFALLTPDNIPTQFNAFALDGHFDRLRALKLELLDVPLVQAVRFPTNSLAGMLAEKARWTPTFGMVVYVSSGASRAAIDAIRQTLLSAPAVVDTRYVMYLDVAASISDAAAILALDPESSAALTPQITPTVFKIGLLDVSYGELDQLVRRLYDLPEVATVRFTSGHPDARGTSSPPSITAG